MIVRCGINSCKTKWLSFWFFYVRINPFRGWACFRDAMIVSRKTWKATRHFKQVQAAKRAVLRS